MTLPLQPNLVGLDLAPAHCVIDNKLSDIVRSHILCSTHDNSASLDLFINQYLDWIKSSTLNNIKGIDTYPVRDYSNGTTEAFDHFYIKNSQRRFRCFRGEYLYHSITWNQSFKNWAWLDDEPLAENDAVVVSLPFADTGNQHPSLTVEFLNACDFLNIPVLIDLAFFGICANIQFDLSHPAITDVAFSLSKCFPVSTLRIGMRLSKQPDALSVYNQTKYVNLLGADVGAKLLKEFGPDTTYDRYRSLQQDFCLLHGLEPSDTVIFGLDTKNQYAKYNRGYPLSNRICFSKVFQHGQWTDSFKL